MQIVDAVASGANRHARLQRARFTRNRLLPSKFSLSVPVFELDAANASEYLRHHHGINARSVSELAGGVSNTVLLIEDGGNRFVLKQSLPQLRVEQDWFADRERILRECAALKLLTPRLKPGQVPAVLFEDPANFAFAMTAAPADASTWKSQLLSGNIQPEVAASIGSLLAETISASWSSQEANSLFGDLTLFEQLRLAPYYGFVAQRHPDLASYFENLSLACRTRAACLVHGDFSPKNLLVDPGGAVTLIDWECIHYGDPAFDSAFLLNHLLLKKFHMPDRTAQLNACANRFWTALAAGMPDAPWFEAATVAHLGGLLLARIDGKSPVEYIREPALRQRIREFARNLIVSPPSSVSGVFERSH